MIRVYCLDADMLNDEGLFGAAYSRASAYRKEKTDAFRFRKDKNLCLGAGILTGYALSLRGLSEDAVEYGFTGNGKPVFVNVPDLHFNISHSGHFVTAAFSDAPVGIDIEKNGTADLRVSGRYFTENEHALILEKEPGPERDRMFFRLWTLKESFMKYLGEGMRLPLHDFEIEIKNGGEPGVSLRGLPFPCRFLESGFLPGYSIALCYPAYAMPSNSSVSSIPFTSLGYCEVSQLIR